MPPFEGYLLDTSVASAGFDSGNTNHESVRRRLEGVDGIVYVSSISIGEVEYGLGVAPQIDTERHDLVRAAMSAYQVIDVDKHTATVYGKIRARLFKQYSPRKRRGRLKKYVGDLIDPTTEKELGIQENDLWIASVAVEYNLVLLTRDRRGGMKRVVEAAGHSERTQFWS